MNNEDFFYLDGTRYVDNGLIFIIYIDDETVAELYFKEGGFAYRVLFESFALDMPAKEVMKNKGIYIHNCIKKYTEEESVYVQEIKKQAITILDKEILYQYRIFTDREYVDVIGDRNPEMRIIRNGEVGPWQLLKDWSINV